MVCTRTDGAPAGRARLNGGLRLRHIRRMDRKPEIFVGELKTVFDELPYCGLTKGKAIKATLESSEIVRGVLRMLEV